MAMYVYWTMAEDVEDRNDLDKLLLQLPAKLHPRARRYKKEAAALNFVIGRLLLKKGLLELGVNEGLEDVKIGERGKPFLESIQFNISHSDDLVVCALSKEGAIGIDVERKKSVVLEHFRDFFTENEWKDIEAPGRLAVSESETVLKPAKIQTSETKTSEVNNPLSRFYSYWTRKECIIKALGVDLNYLHQIELDPLLDEFEMDGKTWSLRQLGIGGKEFECALCFAFAISESETQTSEIEVRRVMNREL